MALRHYRDFITAAEHEHETLAALAAVLRQDDGVELIVDDRYGGRLPLPPSLRQVMIVAVQLLDAQGALALEGLPSTVTLDEAADIVDEPAIDLLAEIERGTVPAHRDETGWSIGLTDLISYATRRDERRAAGLAEIVRIGEEMETQRVGR